MKMSIVLRSRTASMAAEPVSPEVAPTMVARWPRLARSVWSSMRPRSCSATSLKASVGPWNSSSRCRPHLPRYVAERLQRRDLRRLERGIGLADQAAEGRLVEGLADEGPHDAEGQLDIGQALERGDLGLGELRPLGGQIEAAVAGEAREHDVLEAERRGIALRAVAGADVTQDETPTRQPATPLGGRLRDPCGPSWSKRDASPASAPDGSDASRDHRRNWGTWPPSRVRAQSAQNVHS